MPHLDPNDLTKSRSSKCRATVLICTSGRGASIVRTIESILPHLEEDQEILIVDQSRDDSTFVAISSFVDGNRCRYEHLERPGKGHALNFGAANARGEFVCITDDDCEVHPCWVNAHVEVFDRFERVDLTYGQVLAVEHDPEQGFIPAYEISEDHHVRSVREKLNARGIGANTAVRRDALLKLGGFDETLGPGGYFRACVDGDITLRTLLARREVYECSGSIVYHFGFRNWEQGRRLAQNAWFGIGASYAKTVRSGQPLSVMLPAYEFFRFALFPSIVATLLLQKHKGWSRGIYFLRGFWEGARTPLDPATLRYDR